MTALFVATLAGAGRIGYEHANCVNLLMGKCAELGWRMRRQCWGGGGVERGRNIMVAEFLRKTKATDLVFVDSGLSFNPDDVAAMVQSPYDVIGGAYPLKTIDWERVHAAARAGMPASALKWIASGPVLSVTPKQLAAPLRPPSGGTFIECDGVGTGFMVVRRHVLERFVAHFHERIAYQTSVEFDGFDDLHLVFHHQRDPEHDDPSGGYKGEDYAFCQLWRMMGGKVHCYTEAALAQLGSHTFVHQLSRVLPAEQRIVWTPEDARAR